MTPKHDFFPLLSSCKLLPPTPVLLAVTQYKVNASIAHVRLSFEPSFRNAAQTHNSQGEGSVGNKG